MMSIVTTNYFSRCKKVKYGSTRLHLSSPQPDTSMHCQNTNTEPVHYMFTAYLSQHLPVKDGQNDFAYVARYISTWLTQIQTATHLSILPTQKQNNCISANPAQQNKLSVTLN